MTRKGFTLIELMIVVAIIAIIAAIAIPNLLASRKAANETSAIGTLRAIFSAEEQFRILKKKQNSYGTLTEMSQNALFSGIPGSGNKAGYIYDLTVSGGPGTKFSATASPVSEDEGGRMFGVFQSGVITYSTTTTADITSLPID